MTCERSHDFYPKVDRGPPGLGTKQSLTTTVEKSCQSNLAEVKGPKMLRQLQVIDKIISVLLPINKFRSRSSLRISLVV